jgi:cytochrome c2
MGRRAWLVVLAVVVVVGVGAAAATLLSGGATAPRPGEVLDEAKQSGRGPETLKGATEDYFNQMDGGIALTDAEIQGRNNWIVWTGGNDRLWDVLTTSTFGGLDFLKTLSSNPDPKAGLKATRATRWTWYGLVNEPCFEQAKGPDPDHFGLWLDKRITGPGCPPDPFADATKYPGIGIGARGATLPFAGGTKVLPVGSYYGEPTGVIGLRLFPNPAFDEAAARKWDPVRYYTDPDYYLSKDLVRPYRVGMSCGFCHVGPNPINPPADPENPKWDNLSSLVGAQYFWVDRIFFWQADTKNFIFQVFHTARPGTVDTSAISSDNINNPRTMNAVYGLADRLRLAKRFGRETLAGANHDNKQFNDYVTSGPLTEFFQPPDTVFTPRVLKDGADSVGALGALNRVYVNIGLFSEEWLLHFRPLTGGQPITPFEIKVAEKNSSYWAANEAQTPGLAMFLLKASAPHHLSDAPGGAALLSQDTALLAEGKTVFADTCARCHSSKLPDLARGVSPADCAGPGYLDCFGRYWAYTKTPEFKAAMESLVAAPDFLDHNFLSTDLRVPVTLLKTNACSPLATNGLGGNIWDNFTSASYKSLPAVGTIQVRDPFTGAPRDFVMPGGGRGYTRPASLISVWSTAPYFLNNTLGPFDQNPSVRARVASFQSSIEMLLWPEKRSRDTVLGDKGVFAIDRTTDISYLKISAGFLPEPLRPLVGTLERFFPAVFGEGGIMFGPIPKGTPVGLLANLMVMPDTGDNVDRVDHAAKLLALALRLKGDLAALPANASDDEAKKVFANLSGQLLALSKCPDYEVNRGHYFGTSLDTEGPPLTDHQKSALIAFLKTF